MSDAEKEAKKEKARKRRIASDIAGKIHDIVEDTLWDEFETLPTLADELVAACREVKAMEG